MKQPFARCKYVLCIRLHALDIQHQWVTMVGWNRTVWRLYSAQGFGSKLQKIQRRHGQCGWLTDSPKAPSPKTAPQRALRRRWRWPPWCWRWVCMAFLVATNGSVFLLGPLQNGGGGCFSCLLRPQNNGYPEKRHPYASCRVCDRLKITLAGSPCTQWHGSYRGDHATRSRPPSRWCARQGGERSIKKWQSCLVRTFGARFEYQSLRTFLLGKQATYSHYPLFRGQDELRPTPVFSLRPLRLALRGRFGIRIRQVLAAHRAGIRHVIVPFGNQRHVLDEIPEAVLSEVDVRFACWLHLLSSFRVWIFFPPKADLERKLFHFYSSPSSKWPFNAHPRACSPCLFAFTVFCCEPDSLT